MVRRKACISRSLAGLLVAAGFALFVPAAAFAADSVQLASPFTNYAQAVAAQYGTNTPGAGQAPATGAATPTTTNTAAGEAPASGANNPTDTGAGEAPGTAANRNGGKNLPFTGLDLLMVVLLGIALVAFGLLLRAVSRLRQRSQRSRRPAFTS